MTVIFSTDWKILKRNSSSCQLNTQWSLFEIVLVIHFFFLPSEKRRLTYCLTLLLSALNRQFSRLSILSLSVLIDIHVCVCVCVCVCVMHMNLCVCVYLCACACMRVSIYVCIYVYAYMYAYMCAPTELLLERRLYIR